jgi:hypothetical protein
LQLLLRREQIWIQMDLFPSYSCFTVSCYTYKVKLTPCVDFQVVLYIKIVFYVILNVFVIVSLSFHLPLVYNEAFPDPCDGEFYLLWLAACVRA